MLLLQIIVTAISLFAIARTVYHFRTRRFSLTVTSLWCAVWIGVVVVFWVPDMASRLALMVGIGRGADLVMYSAIVVLVYLVYRLFMRVERLQQEITLLTRALTLRNARDKDTSSDTHRQL